MVQKITGQRFAKKSIGSFITKSSETDLARVRLIALPSGIGTRSGSGS